MRLILDYVSSWRNAGFPAWAACLVCLPAVLQAFPGDGSRVYTMSFPAPMANAKVEFQVAYGGLASAWAASAATVSKADLGGWEVTVAIDPAHCVIHCTYRRTREALLLQPITSIRIHAWPGSKPTMVVIDPAGLRFPLAASHVTICPEGFGLPGKGWAARFVLPDAIGREPVPIHAGASPSGTHSPAADSPALPLRI
jgi:hypothetical protein